VHGAKDAIGSDQSMFDLATLGKLGFVPGWPGDDAAPRSRWWLRPAPSWMPMPQRAAHLTGA
jgi:hypothetical protein